MSDATAPLRAESMPGRKDRRRSAAWLIPVVVTVASLTVVLLVALAQ